MQAMSREEVPPGTEEARRRLEERLAAAEEQRSARLAEAASKAGSVVSRAKVGQWSPCTMCAWAAGRPVWRPLSAFFPPPLLRPAWSTIHAPACIHHSA